MKLGEAVKRTNVNRQGGPIGKAALSYYRVWLDVHGKTQHFLFTARELNEAAKRSEEQPEDREPRRRWWEIWKSS